MNEKKPRYIDLSHPIEAPMTAVVRQPEIKYFSLAGQAGTQFNLEWQSGCPHTGTHLDAPFHVDSGLPSLDQLNPAILCGPACVVEVSVPEGEYGIAADDIKRWEEENGAVKTGDSVLLHTGQDRKWGLGDKEFIENGYHFLTLSAACYLVEKKVRFVAVESHCVDKEGTLIHRTLLEHGILIVENVCRLGEIGRARCQTVGTFPAVRGASGAWLRLLAVL